MSVGAYGSQLKAWAVDRVIELYKLDKDSKRTVDDVKKDALALVEFAFNEEECEAAIRLRLEKEVYDREMEAAVALKPASNALDKLKVVPSENPQ